jgi:transcriptional regulator with XRE-family HTH domain
MPGTYTGELDYRTFGTALRDLLIERGITTRLGNPDWPAFSAKVPGVHYETLRKAVTGDRPVAPKIIEAVADALRVDPETFAEYRLWQLRRTFDPADVGTEAALENLARFESEEHH